MCCELAEDLKNCLQIDVCEKSFENVMDKVQNHRIDDLENKVEEINSINTTLAKIEVLVSLQRNDAIKRDKSFDEMNQTQIVITNTLQTLSENLNRTDENVEKLDKKIDDISKNSNINILSFIKKVMYFAIGSGVTISLTKLFSN
jgi:predicted RNase H-like nuclease (RuvC/YqgF family)